MAHRFAHHHMGDVHQGDHESTETIPSSPCRPRANNVVLDGFALSIWSVPALWVETVCEPCGRRVFRHDVFRVRNGRSSPLLGFGVFTAGQVTFQNHTVCSGVTPATGPHGDAILFEPAGHAGYVQRVCEEHGTVEYWTNRVIECWSWHFAGPQWHCRFRCVKLRLSMVEDAEYLMTVPVSIRFAGRRGVV